MFTLPCLLACLATYGKCDVLCCGVLWYTYYITGVDIPLAVQYITSCVTYEGGIALIPGTAPYCILLHTNVDLCTHMSTCQHVKMYTCICAFVYVCMCVLCKFIRSYLYLYMLYIMYYVYICTMCVNDLCRLWGTRGIHILWRGFFGADEAVR